MMEYKGYLGRVEIDEEAGILHGEVVNTRDVITFQGESLADVKREFQKSVDDYLDFCKLRGESPDKPFSGQFVVRISPDLHRKVSASAALAGKSLNVWVVEQLREAVRWPADVPTEKKVTSAGKKANRRLSAHKKSSRELRNSPRRK